MRRTSWRQARGAVTLAALVSLTAATLAANTSLLAHASRAGPTHGSSPTPAHTLPAEEVGMREWKPGVAHSARTSLVRTGTGARRHEPGAVHGYDDD